MLNRMKKSEQNQLFTQSRPKLRPRSQGHLSTFTAQENAGNNSRTNHHLLAQVAGNLSTAHLANKYGLFLN